MSALPIHSQIPSPRSSHHRNPSSSHRSSGLQLEDISHLPIIYPSPSPTSLNQQQQQQQQQLDRRRTHVDGDEYLDQRAVQDAVDDDDGDDDDEWELDREYIDLGAADAYGGYGAVRPRPVHRESQDVEFGNRLTSMRSMRGRGRSARLPHMMQNMKGLQRGKTALLRTLRGGLRRAHAGMMAGHHHSNSSSGHSPPYAFDFRDPQPAPESIRQQYAELAPSEHSAAQAESNAAAAGAMRTENGFLAPPAPMNGPNPNQLVISDKRASLAAADADARSERRHSRSQSDTYRSPVQRDSVHTVRPRPRSRSVASRRSAASADTVVAPQSAPMYNDRNAEEEEDEVDDGDDTAETTLVQHVNDMNLTPIHLSPSKQSRHSKLSLHPHSNRLSHLSHPHSHLDARFPRPLALGRHGRYSRSRLRQYTSKTKSSLVRAVQAFNRLPWMAAPVDPPGALIPSDYYPQPRIAKDFIPSRSSRAKLRGKVTSTASAGVVYKKKGVNLEELENEEENNGGSWYRPSTRQVQRAVRREQYAQQQLRAARGLGVSGGVGGIARPVKQAYATYRAVAGRNGRPLDYMYAPSAGSRTPRSVAPSLYSTRQHSGHGYHDRHANASASSGPVIARPRGVDTEVGAALYGLASRPGSIAAAASAYLTRSASSSTGQASLNARSPPHLRQVGAGEGRRSGVAYTTSAGGVSTIPPTVPSKNGDVGGGAGVQRSRSFSHPQGQAQQQQSQQQTAYAYAYPVGQSQSQAQSGQPVQYYAYGFTYPGAQAQAAATQGARVPGSSPPLPPIPVAPSSGYTGSTSYAPSGHGHSVAHGYGDNRAYQSVRRSASTNESGTIPTIPTAIAPSASTGTQSSTMSSYSYTRPHRHHGHGHPPQHRREYSQHGREEYSRARYEPGVGGREGRAERSASGSSTDSGYGTVVGHGHPYSRSHHGMPMPMRHADYAYPSTYVR
ncbi:hypothetical protein A7U60_g4681 [Sanghuangporus baumii]|uniref:Uncharacterized protein n=1 Tax=Sanghuangporus baumii TaxID=108892 RepID=A0A9Q5HY48_SANBA|nr:hypothetical protein A7U60_g4681 [Sanghuangporus baumii]